MDTLPLARRRTLGGFTATRPGYSVASLPTDARPLRLRRGSVLEAIQRGRRNGNCGSLRRRFSTTNRRFWILDCRFWITNFRPPARQHARGDSQRPPVGIAVTLRRRFSTTSHAGTANSSCEELSRCPELFSSRIVPTWLRIPIVILANLGGMRENFVDYNIFWG